MRILWVILALFWSAPSFGKIEPLAALFQTKTVKGKRVPLSRSPIPEEYRLYAKAKNILENTQDIGAINSVEKELFLIRMNPKAKVLERDFEDLYLALEMRKGSLLVKQKNWAKAIEAFSRGLNGMGTFKWIYYWKPEYSKSLSTLCLRNKKVKDESCLALARRLVDVFPRGALETAALKDLVVQDTTIPHAEMTSERLYQLYTERVERDEEAFKPVLEAFLAQKYRDVPDLAKEFLAQFSRSQVRFRAEFLWAESLWRIGKTNEAQLHYLSVMDQVPLSYYALVSSERAGVSLLDRVKNEPIQIDVDEINPNASEKASIERAKALLVKKRDEEVGIELESFTRTRSYNTDFILYLIQLGIEADQNLFSFKLITELIMRKYDRLLNREFLDFVFPDRYKKEIEEVSALNKVDPILITSLTKQESGFRANVISSSGALGLMQLMPFTAIDTQKDLLLSRLKDPKTNISVGTQYLASLLQKYEGNVIYALSAYNAGPNRVSKWRRDANPEWNAIDFIEAIPFRETRDYVGSILRNRFWYQYRLGLPASKVTDLKISETKP